jgi:alkanesulfonate monooxygenase SsuD/methylene tetrahydromethanopterin reductase-like flavin-dependent oxidoreductase (luciferase family)
VNEPRLNGVGLSLREALPAVELRGLVQRLDVHDQVTLWCPEFAIRDAMAQLAFIAAHTERLRLATGIAPMAARTAVSTAMAAATVDELSGGRMLLGLGVSHQTMTRGWHGQEHASMLGWARDYLTVVGQVLRGEETDWRGEEASSVGFRLLTGGRADVPVVLAALGPQMLSVAARLADGVLLNWTTPQAAAASVRAVREAAAEAGRAPVPVAAYVRVAHGPDAEQQALAHTSFYAELPAYRQALLRAGLPAEDLAAAAARDMVLRGRPEAIAARVQEWNEAGVDQVVVYPVGDETSIRGAIGLAVDVVGLLAEQSPRTTS